MAHFDFYDKRQYFAELNQRFSAAGPGTRILLMTMTFDPTQPAVAELLTNLMAAAKRGADVSFAIDARSFLTDHGLPGPLWYHSKLPPQLRQPYELKRQLLDQLHACPHARAVILNQPGRRLSIPVAGRSHIKIAIIDDYVIIGGCNLDQPANTDLMVGWQDGQVADELYQLMRRGMAAPSMRAGLDGQDRTIRLDDQTRILVDAGVRNQSLIFDEALALIDSARQWLTITCQFFPNSITAQHLLRAKQRGVKVDIIYADPGHHGPISSLGQRYSILRERWRLPADMFEHVIPTNQPFLHAKIIACDGGLLIGSHNYVRAGVRLGTAEIAMQTRDVGLARQAADEITHQLA